MPFEQDRPHVAELLRLSEPARLIRGGEMLAIVVPDKFTRTLLESEAETFRSTMEAVCGIETPPFMFMLRAELSREPIPRQPIIVPPGDVLYDAGTPCGVRVVVRGKEYDLPWN